MGMSSLLTSAIEAMTITNALIVLLIERERERERERGGRELNMSNNLH